MKGVALLVMLSGSGFAFYNYAMPVNQDWVHGKWSYQDQNGLGQEDYMVFHPGGTVDLEGARGKYLSCVYATWGETLSMECEVRGKKREVVFNVSEDQLTLENSSAASVYNKVGATLANRQAGRH